MTLQPLKSGKVRDIYEAGENLVLVASDRVSAFDVVLPTPIPDKGKILSTLSVFWFARTSHIIDNHLLLHRAPDFPSPLREFGAENDWDGRALLCRRAEVLPVECVVRGYLSGSGWKSYQESGEVCGIRLPKGLQESDKLPSPIFTPTTKAEIGDHDAPISWQETVEILGEKRAIQVRDASLQLYDWIAKFALERGLILADTKFEMGICDGDLIVVDEMATPDSSRYWDAQSYQPGRAQHSFDKQFVRDYLETLDWNKSAPGPELPPEVVEKSAAKYVEAYNRLTGLQWPDRDVRTRS
ncbi:phosphoribosylaminoimidazole-succinocarboxamide synthase [Abditibacterium utsteinense]|uniref:Phosphoribosylaminoimidazole-succinocarboxamide synthase n=1 Tax=Abditibacterium utsteinense TaxID=1960156 RepID=A0A2S8SW47_9BACT|nr:phosphoribosylaminoimidazolesuccinocarboxamide synthase [Abditibacterium utsteinense]PQV65020.1 phosphoribosylaminoimidazole-succinocarboxamide synthase [Abditibacterium utsteinense]